MSADVAAASTQPQALPPPIIVLGARPATTAVVGAMLGCNSAAFAFPHLNLFVSDTLEGVVTVMLNQGHTDADGLLRAVAYVYGSEQTIISIGMARRWVMRRSSWSTSQVFDELRKRVAPQRLIDKSAIYSQDAKCLERIRTVLPDAYYVHVVEHPLTPGAMTESVKQGAPASGRRQARTATPRHDQLQWLQAQQLISDALTNIAPERRAILRMENLRSDVRAGLSELCARLDLPNDEVAVADMLHPENSPFAGFGPVGANLGDDVAFLRDPTFPPKGLSSLPVLSRQKQEPMLPEVAQVAARYGYD